jgi:hypothetical protein
MQSIQARATPLLLPVIAIVLLLPWAAIAQTKTRGETVEAIYAMYAPMFEYRCLNAEQLRA